MTPDQIREEMDDIVRFLRKVAASADAQSSSFSHQFWFRVYVQNGGLHTNALVYVHSRWDGKVFKSWSTRSLEEQRINLQLEYHPISK
jgi:hypothetical protein